MISARPDDVTTLELLAFFIHAGVGYYAQFSFES
jgi:hypothetical protein